VKIKSAQLVQVVTNLSGPVRREKYMGREHIVVSSVQVKGMVLHNNLGRVYLPPEDITPEWAEQVNGGPVVTDHPGGSARNPDVMNRIGVGFLYRARAQSGALKSDVFLDPERTGEVEDLQAILTKLEAGENVEVSTGFPVTIEESPGVLNGEEYDRVIHPAGFDHLAVFAEKTGACSIEDGCGLAQNEDLPDPPESPEDLIASSGWKTLLQKAARLLGFRPSDNESDEDRRSLLRSALIERFGADDRYLYVDSVFSDDGLVVFEVESRSGGDSGLFRVGFEINEDGTVTLGAPEEVRRVTTFEPVANAADTPHDNKGRTMNREQMIAQLVESGRDEEALNKLSDNDLKALLGQADSSQVEPTGDGWDKAREYRRKFEALQAETANARETEEKERARLMDDLLYVAQNLPYSEAEIKEMPIVEMRKVHALAFPKRADFSGRGGPAGSSGSFDFVKPVMSGAAGTSVLDGEKEAN